MDDRPRFSEMLVERRLQLGLSIKQASNVLRLKEEVLIAFEEGDFESIPKSGYAQGMLSSYARYLGLNAKTVVNQFSQDLFEHERGAGSHEARRRSRQTRDASDGPLYQTPQASVGQYQRRTYVESRGFLPTSGGFAGDMGDFATTSSPRPRYSSAPRDEGSDSYPQGRPYTTRVPITTTPTPLASTQRRSGAHYAYGTQDQYGSTGRHYSSAYVSRDDVTTRRVMPSQYRDDMLLDNEGGSYQSASSQAGRRSSRNIANTQRPNVRRRSSSEARSRVRNRNQEPPRGGVAGLMDFFLEDRARVIGLIVGLLAVALITIIILTARSCINSNQDTGRSVTVTSTDEKTDEAPVEDNTLTADEQRAREDAAAAKAAETEASTAERTIEVTVDEGQVTWLEIEYDGNSDVAETVTGPWNRTYTVRQSISINVNNTAAVTVTEGGKKLEFDSKASGIGTITIQVSKKADEAEEGTEDGEKQSETENADGTQTQQTDGQTNTQQQGQVNNETQTQQTTGGSPYEGYTLDADGYYYGADGYYDAQGNFYQY